MKIDGKRLAETHLSLSGMVAKEEKSNESVIPRLLARLEHAEKFMPAMHGGCKTGVLSASPHIGALPYQALFGQINTGFPDTGQQASKGRVNEQISVAYDSGLSFDEQPSDQRIVHQQMRNLARYFTDTWPSRLPFSQQQQFEQGNYVLLHGDGETRPCATYLELARFVSGGTVPDMPERLLHVAGPRLPNFLCQTYLYNPALCLFGHIGQHRIEPLAELRTLFEVAHNQNGEIRVQYTASDDHVDRIILVGPRENDEFEAELLAPASVRFSGTLLFAPDGGYAVGPVQMRASAIRLQTPQDMR